MEGKEKGERERQGEEREENRKGQKRDGDKECRLEEEEKPFASWPRKGGVGKACLLRGQGTQLTGQILTVSTVD